MEMEHEDWLAEKRDQKAKWGSWIALPRADGVGDYILEGKIVQIIEMSSSYSEFLDWLDLNPEQVNHQKMKRLIQHYRC